ncbi:hypothetical protein [Anabaena sp. CCY 9402-a]|uniref:hypothetical protein n=1 Tax=Anabaena sp. CCY 9402-a TaxID=3103867 RepID=UPI0039C60B1D
MEFQYFSRMQANGEPARYVPLGVEESIIVEFTSTLELMEEGFYPERINGDLVLYDDFDDQGNIFFDQNEYPEPAEGYRYFSRVEEFIPHRYSPLEKGVKTIKTFYPPFRLVFMPEGFVPSRYDKTIVMYDDFTEQGDLLFNPEDYENN